MRNEGVYSGESILIMVRRVKGKKTSDQSEPGRIVIAGARVNNLKNLSISIPKQALVVVTGVSGSGKSSLVFDTIVAEAQRRFVAGLSPLLRQRLQRYPHVAVDHISGLLPAVAVRNRYQSPDEWRDNPLDDIGFAVATLLSRTADLRCPDCKERFERYSPDEVAKTLLRHQEARVMITASRALSLESADGLEEGSTSSNERFWDRLLKEGFSRVLVDGELYLLDDGNPPCDAESRIEVVIDRIKVSPDREKRLSESLRLAFNTGGGVVAVYRSSTADEESERECYSDGSLCPFCLAAVGTTTVKHFTGNAPNACCAECKGEGCSACSGSGLVYATREAQLFGKTAKELLTEPLSELDRWGRAAIEPLSSEADLPDTVSLSLLRDIQRLLLPLLRLDLGYLSLCGARRGLSSGEYQKASFARALSLEMGELLIALDEPLSGLHHAERPAVREMIGELRDRGNTVIVVEHDPKILADADLVIEIGPGAGEEGGEVVYKGEGDGVPSVEQEGRELLPPLSGNISEVPSFEFNLKPIFGEKEPLRIPKGKLVGICGHSGTGKSRLLEEVIVPQLNQKESADVQVFDQAPVGKNARSCPATYLGMFDGVRDFFSSLPEARIAGYDASTFSFNTPEGRCKECSGAGILSSREVVFDSQIFLCPNCSGQRYLPEVLRVRYRGLSIGDVLGLTVEQALKLFEHHPGIADRLRVLSRVGLGYLPLGQPSNSLSGGEAQRLKLAAVLGKGAHSPDRVIVLDQPARGLNDRDLPTIAGVIEELVEQGATAIVVEASREFLMRCQWIIELGRPSGRMIFKGTAEGFLKG
jgi:excinuclease ABC subunit A